MIEQKYFEGQYTMIPLTISADFSFEWLAKALLLLGVDNLKYTLHIGEDNLSEVLDKKISVVDMEIVVQQGLKDGWYVVKDKTIVYSPGA